MYRTRFAVAALVATTLAATIASGATAAPRMGIDDFLTGLACVESSGRFTALNERTGAYGKYQVTPRNWISWAGRYLGNPWAAPTPSNQQYVVTQRVGDLFEVHPNWRRVAHWWLTGNAAGVEQLWSPGSLRYVDRVIAFAKAAASSAAAIVPARCFPQHLGRPTVRTQPFPRVRVTGGAVNVRRSAGYEFRTLTVARRGQTLAVLWRGRDARGEPWLHVGLPDGRTGWIASWLTAPLGQ